MWVGVCVRLSFGSLRSAREEQQGKGEEQTLSGLVWLADGVHWFVLRTLSRIGGCLREGGWPIGPLDWLLVCSTGVF